MYVRTTGFDWQMSQSPYSPWYWNIYIYIYAYIDPPTTPGRNSRQSVMVVPAVGRVWLFCTQTLHGTAIYTYIDPSGTTTPTDRPSYGSPSWQSQTGRVWVEDSGMTVAFLPVSLRPYPSEFFGIHPTKGAASWPTPPGGLWPTHHTLEVARSPCHHGLGSFFGRSGGWHPMVSPRTRSREPECSSCPVGSRDRREGQDERGSSELGVRSAVKPGVFQGN